MSMVRPARRRASRPGRRPRRLSDREGHADQATGQGRDDRRDDGPPIFATLVLVGMLMFLVPVLRQDLRPARRRAAATLTQWVVKASNLLRVKWFIRIPAMIGSVVGFRRWKRSESGRKLWDRFQAPDPVEDRRRRPQGDDGALHRGRSRRSSLQASTSSRRSAHGRQTAGNWVVERSPTCASASTRACRSRN